MKRICVILLLICSFAASAAPTGVSQLSADDLVKLKQAIKLMDSGAVLSSIDMLDSLAVKYPKDYYVAYETLFAYYLAEKYDEVVKRGKKLFKHPEATQLIYQIVGNAYDEMGRRDEAEKTYKNGLKRFPDSGELWLELGIMRMKSMDYGGGFEAYEKGITVCPTFSSNYIGRRKCCLTQVSCYGG